MEKDRVLWLAGSKGVVKVHINKEMEKHFESVGKDAEEEVIEFMQDSNKASDGEDIFFI